jgi:hypothetical protein
LTVSASLLNFGFIYLRSPDIQYYQLDTDFKINTKFPDIPSSLSGLGVFLKQTQYIINSFSQKFTTAVRKGKYESIFLLPAHIYLGANYLFNQQHDLNFLLHLMTIPQLKKWITIYDVGIGYVWRTPIFQPVINYHINSYNFVNLGIGILFNIKNFQIHFLIDDLLLSGGDLFVQIGAHWLFRRDAPKGKWATKDL